MEGKAKCPGGKSRCGIAAFECQPRRYVKIHLALLYRRLIVFTCSVSSNAFECDHKLLGTCYR